MTLKELTGTILLIAFGVILAFGSGEIAVRLLQRMEIIPTYIDKDGFLGKAVPKPTFPTKTHMRLKWLDHPVLTAVYDERQPTINDEGVRDRNYPIDKPDRTIRIAVMGDSVTFGLNVTPEQTYPKQLERLLNDRTEGFNYEVMNFGVSGYGTFEEAALYHDRVSKYKPDMVVVGYCLNDQANMVDMFFSLGKLDWIEKNQALTQKQRDASYKRAMEHRKKTRNRASQLVAFVQYRFWQIFNTGSATNDQNKKAVENRGAEPDEKMDEYNRNKAEEFLDEYNRKRGKEFLDGLDSFSEISKTDNIPVLFIIFPYFEQFDNYPHHSKHEKIRTALHQRHVPYSDLFDVYRDLSAHKLKAHPLDTTHPNALAHSIAAKHLLRLLDDERYLSRAYDMQ